MQTLFLACATANAVVLAKIFDLLLDRGHDAFTPESLRIGAFTATVGILFAAYGLTLEKYAPPWISKDVLLIGSAVVSGLCFLVVITLGIEAASLWLAVTGGQPS